MRSNFHIGKIKRYILQKDSLFVNEDPFFRAFYRVVHKGIFRLSQIQWTKFLGQQTSLSVLGGHLFKQMPIYTSYLQILSMGERQRKMIAFH